MATATKKKTSARGATARKSTAAKKTSVKKTTAKRSTTSRASTAKRSSTRVRGMQPKGMKTGRRKTSTASRSKSASRSNKGNITTDHDEIREWAEARNGTPASVLGTRRGKDEAGLLRIDFPGYSGEDSLCPIEWDEFFEKFEESNLAFLHGEGKRSRFNKFIARSGSPRSKSRRK